MRVHFTDQGWTDYLHWSRHDPKIHARLNELIEDARRSPFKGIGKPEPLKGDLAGFWSRRVTGEHRLVYTVEGKTGADQRIAIVLCRYHIEDRAVCALGPPGPTRLAGMVERPLFQHRFQDEATDYTEPR